MTNPLKRGVEDQIDNSSKRRATEANVHPATHLSTEARSHLSSATADPCRAIAVPRRATTSNIKNHLQSTSLTKEQEQLRQKIDVLAEGTPRFLFRFWSEQSGGNKDLNTIEKITPHAFLDKEGPEALHKMKLSDIHDLSLGHLTGKRLPSVFSSWSQSLPLLLGWAQRQVRDRGRKGMHISVLDTAKVDASNTILHTDALRIVANTPWDEGRYRWEYLIFGVVKTPAYRAIPLKYFEPTLVPSPPMSSTLPSTVQPLLNHILQQPKVERKIDMINEIAQRYGNQLEVPVAAHLMAMVLDRGKDTAKQDEYLANLASTMPIPPELAHDPKIMDHEVNYHGYMECFRAHELLQKLVVIKHGRPKARPSQPAPGREKGRLPFAVGKKIKKHGKPTEAEAKLAVESVTSSARVPEAAKKTYRMVTDLFILSKGYEMSNRQIEEFKKENA
ncbi:hypothetical protein PRZ48_006285 [Zasmidium cellare]|uniref:DUF7587 domain-containing protein n=1 Tax=Zasmidium cellare TaxID=395010 RepID=A0ABR0ENC9_ZASCE|nr:hypothetical protein PRZ48_006285 [Zasmidium cellare]